MDFRNISRLELMLFKFASNILRSKHYEKTIRGLGLKGTETVIEPGSGTGAASRYIARSLDSGGKLISLDISAAMQEDLKRTLRDFRNVEYRLGEIKDLAVEPGTADVVFIHFMLHDVEPEKRLPAAAVLALALKENGRMHIFEPVSRSHGMPALEIEKILRKAGLEKISSEVIKPSFFRPAVYSGVFKKALI